MKLYSCRCGNTLFFESTRCVACGSDVGWCPACRAIRTLEPEGDGGHFRCSEPSCGTLLAKCVNYAEEEVCNRCLEVDGSGPGPGSLCAYCRFNETIPDLSVPGNREKWGRIEAAKRRLFYVLDELGLPYGTAAEGFDPPLSFDFKGDVVPEGRWRATGGGERVYTGHANGKITININEADDADRERLRVDLGEAQRTLIGHFRHEIGHYYWDLLVRGRREEPFKRLFGDHENAPYGEAMERHYREGPPADWRERYVSAYATMHPWEDWAETFGLYLDIASVLETAANMELIPRVPRDDLEAMLRYFHDVGVVANEINRTMGLVDLVPEVITPTVQEKLSFAHGVIYDAVASSGQVPRLGAAAQPSRPAAAP